MSDQHRKPVIDNIAVYTENYKGNNLVHVRKVYTEGLSSAIKPTAKGIAMSKLQATAVLPALIELLTKLVDEEEE